jgi:hypothetical protein
MPEVLLRFLLDLSPKDAKLVNVWLDSNPLAVEQMLSVIGKPSIIRSKNLARLADVTYSDLRRAIPKVGR